MIIVQCKSEMSDRGLFCGRMWSRIKQVKVLNTRLFNAGKLSAYPGLVSTRLGQPNWRDYQGSTHRARGGVHCSGDNVTRRRRTNDINCPSSFREAKIESSDTLSAFPNAAH